MARLKDSERRRVYTAENKAFTHTVYADKVTFEDAADRLRHIATMLQIAHPTVIKASGGGSWAQQGHHRIALSNHGCCDWVIIHELTHLQINRVFPPHGLEWRMKYLGNLTLVLGREASNLMRDQFIEAGLSWRREAALFKRVRADFTWRAKRPGTFHMAYGQSDAKVYDRMSAVLIDGSVLVARTDAAGEWNPEHLAQIESFIKAEQVAYIR